MPQMQENQTPQQGLLTTRTRTTKEMGWKDSHDPYPSNNLQVDQEERDKLEKEAEEQGLGF